MKDKMCYSLPCKGGGVGFVTDFSLLKVLADGFHNQWLEPHFKLHFHVERGESLSLNNSRCVNLDMTSHYENGPAHCSIKLASRCAKKSTFGCKALNMKLLRKSKINLERLVDPSLKVKA